MTYSKFRKRKLLEIEDYFFTNKLLLSRPTKKDNHLSYILNNKTDDGDVNYENVIDIYLYNRKIHINKILLVRNINAKSKFCIKYSLDKFIFRYNIFNFDILEQKIHYCSSHSHSDLLWTDRETHSLYTY